VAGNDAADRPGKRIRLAYLIATGGSVHGSAKASGVAVTTASRWYKHDEGFQRLLDDVRRELIRRLVDREVSLNIAAGNTLKELLKSENEDIKMRAVNSARASVPAILAHLALLARLEAVEARLDEREGSAGPGVPGANGFPR
jgi:hypothetical protein